MKEYTNETMTEQKQSAVRKTAKAVKSVIKGMDWMDAALIFSCVFGFSGIFAEFACEYNRYKEGEAAARAQDAVECKAEDTQSSKPQAASKITHIGTKDGSEGEKHVTAKWQGTTKVLNFAMNNNKTHTR